MKPPKNIATPRLLVSSYRLARQDTRSGRLKQRSVRMATTPSVLAPWQNFPYSVAFDRTVIMFKPCSNFSKIGRTWLKARALQKHGVAQTFFGLQQQMRCRSQTSGQRANDKLNKMLPRSKQGARRKSSSSPASPAASQPNR